VYRAASEDACAHEITVEDPSPGFCALRDRMDIQCCVTHKFFSLSPFGAAAEDTALAGQGSSTSKLTTDTVKHIQSVTKLTTGQVNTNATVPLNTVEVVHF
jgi:hypothetical protein